MMQECPACHTFNRDEAKFCAFCGARLVCPETQDPHSATDNILCGQAEKEQNHAPMPAFDGKDMQADLSVPAIQNETPLTPATLREFYAPTRIAGFILLIGGAVIVLLQILLTASGSEKSDILLLYFGIVFLACGAAYIGLYYGVFIRSKLFTDTTHALYTCNDEGMIQYMYDTDKKTGEQFVAYAQITKVTARKNFLVVRFGVTAWLVDRRTFTQGTEADFLALLRSRGVNVKVKAN